nr:MAG TPA: hypothetical protein [Caudoviricetes sp.]
MKRGIGRTPFVNIYIITPQRALLVIEVSFVFV